ncbi:MAG: hypothetical protein QM715_08340 [Nibricoccus sp.]
MKIYFALLLVAALAFGGRLAAHDFSAHELGPLSPEEARLIRDFRENPEPYRRLLYAQHAPPQRPHHAPVLGPRDVIDVTVEGGLIAFNGKRRGYEPVSFRIVRGETITIAVRRERHSEETSIVVSYRADGLHFDVPRQTGRAEPRGFVVIGEDPRWQTGAPILFDDTVNSSRSISEAQAISFHIRYAASRRP